MSDQPVALQWQESRDIFGISPVLTAITQRNRYDITHDARKLQSPWWTRRTPHPLMPSFDGWCETLDEAKEACEYDAIGLARADRWLDYMLENEPPVGGTV